MAAQPLEEVHFLTGKEPSSGADSALTFSYAEGEPSIITVKRPQLYQEIVTGSVADPEKLTVTLIQKRGGIFMKRF